MSKTAPEYTRCRKCKELVTDADNCANCANRNPLAYGPRSQSITGKRGCPTLDIQEGNLEEMA